MRNPFASRVAILRHELALFAEGDVAWARLERELAASGAGEAERQVAARSLLNRLAKRFGPHAPVARWAKPYVASEAVRAHSAKAAGPIHRPHQSTTPPARISDAAALRALILHLHTRQGERLSVVARAWGISQPGLSETWADEAIKRLAAAGVLVKARGTGRSNLPAWRFAVGLQEALGRAAAAPKSR